jgi:hypothetical protein
VGELGMETCVTLGMLTDAQAKRLADAGLDYYNHNLDTSPDFYGEIITTRTYQDRLDTLGHVREAGVKPVLRRHRRHGREPPPAGRAARPAGPARPAPRERADQPAGAGAGHAAARHRGSTWIPSSWSAPSPRPHHDAGVPRAPVRRDAAR